MVRYTDETLPAMDRWDVSVSLRTPLEAEAAQLPDGVYQVIEFSRVPTTQRALILRCAIKSGYERDPDFVVISGQTATSGARYGKVTCGWRDDGMPLKRCA